ncbi:MAG TPA: hypothetical protein VL443_24140 [Cyclobacteriaceae bacterium]|jgi:hypothetical protein|nr:hypothetical protein [Cyclobacteriaceae bacterium]
MEIFHIYPLDEEKQHNLVGYVCECNPETEYIEDENCVLVKHNSFDGREALEEAKRILGYE